MVSPRHEDSPVEKKVRPAEPSGSDSATPGIEPLSGNLNCPSSWNIHRIPISDTINGIPMGSYWNLNGIMMVCGRPCTIGNPCIGIGHHRVWTSLVLMFNPTCPHGTWNLEGIWKNQAAIWFHSFLKDLIIIWGSSPDSWSSKWSSSKTWKTHSSKKIETDVTFLFCFRAVNSPWLPSFHLWFFTWPMGTRSFGTAEPPPKRETNLCPIDSQNGVSVFPIGKVKQIC